eukprot:02314_2
MRWQCEYKPWQSGHNPHGRSGRPRYLSRSQRCTFHIPLSQNRPLRDWNRCRWGRCPRRQSIVQWPRQTGASCRIRYPSVSPRWPDSSSFCAPTLPHPSPHPLQAQGQARAWVRAWQVWRAQKVWVSVWTLVQAGQSRVRPRLHHQRQTYSHREEHRESPFLGLAGRSSAGDWLGWRLASGQSRVGQDRPWSLGWKPAPTCQDQRFCQRDFQRNASAQSRSPGTLAWTGWKGPLDLPVPPWLRGACRVPGEQLPCESSPWASLTARLSCLRPRGPLQTASWKHKRPIGCCRARDSGDRQQWPLSGLRLFLKLSLAEGGIAQGFQLIRRHRCDLRLV